MVLWYSPRHCLALCRMPLRSKITNPAFSAKGMATGNPSESAEAPPVLFGSHLTLRTINLNRPKKLNALNKEMCDLIIPELLKYEKSELAKIVLIQGNGGKALCAGGDVAAVAQAVKQRNEEGYAFARSYFGREYLLDQTIATYTKPVVAFIDGITMGGGVGLTLHAPFRVATERTLFAMPETTIGFFPDVGASFFLPRMDGQLGKYLGLTSNRLKGYEAFFAGVATHYVNSEDLPALQRRLSELDTQDLDVINAAIEDFSTATDMDKAPSISGNLRESIDKCFKHNDIPSILDALDKDGSTWANETAQTIRQRSAISCAVTAEMIRRGKSWSILESFRNENIMATHIVQEPDFVEGVEARLVRKPAQGPKWTVTDVKQVDVDKYFEDSDQVTPLEEIEGRNTEERDYDDYPWTKYGLPREKEIRSFVTGYAKDSGAHAWSRSEIIKRFLRKTNSKKGVVEKVNDVIDRKCVPLKSQDGPDTEPYLKWKD